MPLLLLTGIPGTGKTKLGEYLAANHGLRHVDMEAEGVLQVFVQDRERFLAALGSDVVLSWGFHVNHSPDVRFLKTRGYLLVWLDGDRPAALKAFIARNTVSEAAFYLQMFTIEKESVVARVQPDAILNPFRAGTFRPLPEIAGEILTLWEKRGAA